MAELPSVVESPRVQLPRGIQRHTVRATEAQVNTFHATQGRHLLGLVHVLGVAMAQTTVAADAPSVD